MDVYYDVLYRIENGRFLQTARGDYTTNFEASNASGDLVFDYTWNGSPVSSATYRNNLATLFDQTRAEASGKPRASPTRKSWCSWPNNPPIPPETCTKSQPVTFHRLGFLVS